MNINEQIRERRKLVGMTQQQLADAAGLSLQTIKFIETGRRASDKRTRQKIAAALQCEYIEELRPIKKKL